MKKLFVISSTICFLMIVLSLSSPSAVQAAMEPVFTVDHFPLDEGAKWVYSISPSTVTFEYEGDAYSITFSDMTVSVPAGQRMRTEMIFTGKVKPEGMIFELDLSGDVVFEEQFVVESGEIKIASEEGTGNMSIPGIQTTVNVRGSGTYDAPMAIVKHGMKTGESINFSSAEAVDWTMVVTEGGQQSTETGEESLTVSGSSSVEGEGTFDYNGQSLDTIEVQLNMDVTPEGEPTESTQSTAHFARFIGTVKEDGYLPGFWILENTGPVTLTLEYTNLPVWDTIDTYTVDAGTGDFIEFPYNSGNVSIEIPAGCLSDSTTLTAGDVSNIPDSPGVNGITWAVGLTIDDPGVTLSCPMTLMLPYTQADLDAAGVTDPGDLVVYRWSSVSSGWEALSVTAVDTDNKTVSVEISQLSVFGVGAPEDTAPPTVASTSPVDGADDVSVNTAITATFSEPMDASTIDETTFVVNDGASDIAGTVTYDDVTATLTPDEELNYDTTYTATVTTGARDLAGNPLQNSYEWSFTTKNEEEPPAVLSTNPADGADDILVETVITATFSEAMDADTINTDTFLVSDGVANIPGTVSYEAGTATFTPTASLHHSVTYTATITTGAQDPAGNPMETDYQWSFTTEPVFTVDYFPLNKGSEWAYSVSPPTVTFDYEGNTVSLTFGDISVSVPSEGWTRSEMPFTGTVDSESFSGTARYDAEYVVNSDSIKLVAEEVLVSMNTPSSTESITYYQFATYLSPLTVLEHGMGIGDTISNSGRVKIDWTLDYAEGGDHESESGTEEFSVSVTTTIVGEEEVLFDGEPLDTIEVQMNLVVNGTSSEVTMNLARFVGPVQEYGGILGLEEIFGDIGQVSRTLKSTNLPVWASMRTYAVDSSTGASLDFNFDGDTVEINIPASCLSNSTTLTVGGISNIPDSRGVKGITWAVGINIDEPGVTLHCPITVTLPYTQADLDDAGISDPNDLKVYRWSSPLSGWQALEVVAVDTDNQTISVQVSQLSVFALGGPSPSGGGGSDCFIGTAANGLGW